MVVASVFFIIILVINYLYAFVFIVLEFYQQYLTDGIFGDINFDFSVFILLIFVHFY